MMEVEIPYDEWVRLNQAFETYRAIADRALAERHLDPEKGTPILFSPI